jgi:hypothetical protein
VFRVAVSAHDIVRGEMQFVSPEIRARRQELGKRREMPIRRTTRGLASMTRME